MQTGLDMKRKVYDRLLQWKQQRHGTTAVLLTGARRVGKSYVVKQFAEREYRSHVIIDFNSASKDIRQLFDDYLSDLDTFYLYLSTYTNTVFYRRDTLIVFDEVQLCPRARAAIKYLVADGRYDFVETGSLVSIKKNVADIVIPSEEEEVRMWPMDFEEFLWAMGNETLMPVVRQCYGQLRPMGQALHRKAMGYMREYMIVGGMPQAVAEYAATRDFASTDRIKRQILTLYRNDAHKFAAGYEAKVVGLFDAIPSQLQKHEKRFSMRALGQGARGRDYETSFFWLDDARIVNMAYNTTAPDVGLELCAESSTLKCYMGDTGLLISLAFRTDVIDKERLYAKILADKLEWNSGMVVENVVAQMLRAAGHGLFFFSRYDKKDAANRMEIDFLIPKRGVSSRHNISPVEVKSSVRYTLTSLRKCIAKYGAQLSTPYVVHTADLCQADGIVYLPLYMTPLL